MFLRFKWNFLKGGLIFLELSPAVIVYVHSEKRRRTEEIMYKSPAESRRQSARVLLKLYCCDYIWYIILYYDLYRSSRWLVFFIYFFFLFAPVKVIITIWTRARKRFPLSAAVHLLRVTSPDVLITGARQLSRRRYLQQYYYIFIARPNGPESTRKNRWTINDLITAD